MKSRGLKTIFAILLTILSAVALPNTAASQALIESYVAYLSFDDHYNSEGQRLTEPWQIVRQDRANFHRFGIMDAGDEWDSFFESADNRAALEQMILSGYIAPAAANSIVNSNVWIRVDIYGRGGVGTYVEVWVIG